MKFAVIERKHIAAAAFILVWLIAAVTVIYCNLSKKDSPEIKEKRAAVIFDCAGDDRGADSLLALLNEYGVKSTFFISSDFADKYPETLRKIVNAGHETGLIASDSPEAGSCRRKIKKITGITPRLIRGKNTDIQDMKAVVPDVYSGDSKNKSPSAIAERVISQTEPDSVILFNVGKENTLEALPVIIETLKKSGYEFLKAGEII